MTANDAKKHVRMRLESMGVLFDRLSSKTVDFSGLGYGSSIFVTIHGAECSMFSGELKDKLLEGIEKPSNGGFCVEFKGYTKNDTLCGCPACESTGGCAVHGAEGPCSYCNGTGKVDKLKL
jgi:hypothetical protein